MSVLIPRRMEAVLGLCRSCFCPGSKQKEMERLIAKMPTTALGNYFADSVTSGCGLMYSVFHSIGLGSYPISLEYWLGVPGYETTPIGL